MPKPGKHKEVCIVYSSQDFFVLIMVANINMENFFLKFTFLRFEDWFFKHSAVLVSIFILSLDSNKLFPKEILGTMLFSICTYCYAFGLNYYVERESDKKVGKNRVDMLRPWEAWLLLGLLTTGIFTSALVWRNWLVLAIAVFTFFMATAYSLPPFYFKQRGWFSTVSQAIFLVVPHLWFFLAITEVSNPLLAVYLSLWLVLITLKGATIHQLVDYVNDAQIGWRTFAVVYGLEETIRFTRVIVYILYGLALIGLFLFRFPINWIVVLVVGLSNPTYKPRKNS
jgi:4-hydroxybenzoate polyprenyltransferase